MKKHLKRSLERIDKYIKETPSDIIDKELEACKIPECDGPTLNEYFSFLQKEIIESCRIPRNLLDF